ncbi:MAG: hypothetical protein OQK69_00730, partial [Gammaproteobacteria bacterium]|nr:hypothetical protein [Gammaproteobacteria bacterium]
MKKIAINIALFSISSLFSLSATAADSYYDPTLTNCQGTFGDLDCWLNGDKPASPDNAIFDTGAITPYTLTFTGSPTNNAAYIKVDNLIWDITGYNIYAVNTLAVGNADYGEADASLQVIDGNLLTIDTYIGAPNSGDPAATSTNSGTLTLTGSGTGWWNQDSLTLGNVFSTGTVNALDGAQVQIDGMTYIGQSYWSEGGHSINIDGVGTSWISNDKIYLGMQTSAEINITNGGTLSSSGVHMGSDGVSSTFFASGAVTVDGTGSTWEDSGTLYIGDSQYGNGTVNVINGGVVSATDAIISNYGSGEVNVTGAGSIWSSSGYIAVGNRGTGTLNISEGATVSSQTGIIGGGLGGSAATATVNVDGSGSSWDNAASIYLGDSGTGTLNILNGGTVTSSNVYVSGGLNGTGSILIDGAGSGLNISGNQTRDDDVGISTSSCYTPQDSQNSDPTWSCVHESGVFMVDVGTTDEDVTHGSVTVQNGGSLVTGWNNYVTNGGSVSVDGVGSTWNASGAIWVGIEAVGGAVNIKNGGEVVSDGLLLGFEPNVEGTVTVDGEGSRLETTDTLNLGWYGGGTINVLNGGSFISNLSLIGGVIDLSVLGDFNIHSVINVDGAGSSWTVSDTQSSLYGDGMGLIVGWETSGEVNITNGGVVYADTGITLGNAEVGYSGFEGVTGEVNINSGGELYSTTGVVGNFVHNTGFVTVDGAGSNWVNAGELVVGRSGTGWLNINNGGSVSNTDGFVGRFSGAPGTVNVAGGTWNNSGNLYVGNYGTGELNISSGGTVSNAYGYLGRFSGSDGVATIDGTGSIWTNTGDLTLGAGGDGTLTLSNGGEVIVGGQLINGTGTGTINFDGGTLSMAGNDLDVDNFNVGFNSGSNGSYAVAAGESVSATTVVIGASGTGALDINNGGSVSNTNAYLGNDVTGTGAVTVDGTGSIWTNTGDLTLGAGGDGTLTLSNGGEVIVGGQLINGSGTSTINFDGGALSMASNDLDVDNFNVGFNTGSNASYAVGAGESVTTTTVAIGASGTGALDINNGGSVSSTDAFLGRWNSVGTVTVDGIGSSWNNSGSFYVGNYGWASLAITNGGAVSSVDTYLGRFGSSNGTATISGAGSIWTNTGDLTLGAGGDGTLTLSNGGEVIVGGQLINGTGTGTINFDGGTLSMASNDLDVDNFNVGFNTGSNASYAVASGESVSATTVAIGASGTGALDINNGGSVSNTDAYLGRFASGIGTVMVDGTGSSWNNSGSLYIGGDATSSGGTATLSISNDAVVNVGDTLQVFDTGTLNLAGGSITTTSFDAATGSFNFTDGSLTVDGGTYSDGNTDLTIDSVVAGANPTLILDNSASAVVAGDLNLGNAGTGTLTLSNGSELIIGGQFINGSGTSTINFDGGTLSMASNDLDVDNFYVGFNTGSTGSYDIGAGESVSSTTAEIGVYGTGVLNISNGATVNNTTGRVGRYAGSTGTVTVDGAGSSWSNSDVLYVGINSSGTLNIDNGGVVSSSAGVLGYNADGAGTATVDGAGSSWNSAGDMTLGRNGAGVLNATNGGAVSSSGVLYIGKTANGTLNINNGGLVSSSEGWLGFNAAGVGTATVDGTGSGWNSTGNMTVGANGSGELNVSNGGVVSNATAYLGRYTGGVGTATVDGAGSSWNSSGALYIGSVGNAALNINNGGSVTNTNAVLGYFSGGVGSITVNSAGSSWNNNGNLTIGRAGAGTLNINNGGNVSNVDAYLGRFADGVGTVTVDGVGSSWNNSG